jgi:hypothetical protein
MRPRSAAGAGKPSASPSLRNALAARHAAVIERSQCGALGARRFRAGQAVLPRAPASKDRIEVTRPAQGCLAKPHRFPDFIARAMACGALAVVASGMTAGCAQKARPQLDLAASKVTTIGVNAYLWRASLETLSFMPLVQTDSNGGVIVTDWYTNPRNPGERMKVTVSILDQDLRADALRIAASRQTAQGGNWIDAPVQAATVQKLEDIILTKARDLRRQTVRG